MRVHGDKRTYDDREITVFLPMWKTISQDSRLNAERDYLAAELIDADEVSIMEGTSPLYPRLDAFAKELKQKAGLINSSLDEIGLSKFVFFVLNHRPEDFD